MILTALDDCYRRLLETPGSGIAMPGYSQEKIGYTIVLAPDGGVVSVDDEHENNGRTRIARILSVPASFKRPGTGAKPFFLWDKTGYVLGVSASSTRCEQQHDAFKRLHRDALATLDDPGLNALLAFLDTWHPDHFRDHPQFKVHGEALLDAHLVFRLDGELGYLHDRPAAREAWSQRQGQGSAIPSGMCLVSGLQAPLARLHPAIKGVNGAQAAGASIVSFNLDAFTSYGKKQGENAPVSERAAFAYTTVLNHLLRRGPGNRQRLQIGDTTVVFWAQAAQHESAAAAEDLVAAMLGSGETDEQATARLQTALEQIRQGRPLRELPGALDDDARIFVLGLAPNASRLSIRFWETRTLAGFAERLAEHYQDLALVPAAWKRPPSPQFLALQTAPVHGEKGRPKAEDVPPLLAGELTRAILSGGRYPRSLLAAVVMRFRADKQVTPLRVALCKAVLARDARLAGKERSSSTKGEPPMSLDPDNSDPGYLLGRLFSTLEHLQRSALGGNVNATIRDRYYGAASATPAGIFPVLLRNAQNHLGKVRRDKPGLAVNIEKEIGQILGLVGASFPRSLLIDAQGRFAIGYYHQTQARFSAKDGQGDVNTTFEGEPA